jgi:glutamate/tyrosine decarboxylase-like PLP-dependent enzyme
VFTVETCRPGGSVLSALANLSFFGREGYRALLGHIATVAEALRERLEKSTSACLVNDCNYGPVKLFRVYPNGVDARSATYTKGLTPLRLSGSNATPTSTAGCLSYFAARWKREGV